MAKYFKSFLNKKQKQIKGSIHAIGSLINPLFVDKD